jgi:riboflavin kinase/FMN adenylyltransferase
VRILTGAARPRRPLVATIGVFDGVHLGHRVVLDRTLARARATGREPAVITFDRHPLATLAPRAAPRCLMTLPQRLRAFAALGFRTAVMLRFDRRLADLSAKAFVRRVLVRRLGVAELVVGYDFHFGRGGAGDAALLGRLGDRLGFRVTVAPPRLRRGEPVSSTRIRKLVILGNVTEAARLLGRPYAIEGRIVRGRRLGRRIGFPTINLAPRNDLLPRHGVYAARLGPGRAPAVVNLGVRPTVDRGRTEPLLEAHVLGPPPPLPSGRTVEAELVSFLRPERRFPDLAALTRQIARDAARARRLLHQPSRSSPGAALLAGPGALHA